MNEIILIRHGQSEYNLKLTKDLDSPLSDEGVRQVEETAKYLNENFNLSGFVGHSSPYLRCLQTSQIIQEYTGIKFSIDPRIREIMTCYDSCFVENRSETYHMYDWSDFTESQFHKESEFEFTSRICRYHNEIQAWGDKMLMVSHGTPITSLIEMLNGTYFKPNVVEYVRNSSINYFVGKDQLVKDKIVY